MAESYEIVETDNEAPSEVYLFICRSKAKYRPAHCCDANLGVCDSLKPVLILVHIQFRLTLYHHVGIFDKQCLWRKNLIFTLHVIAYKPKELHRL